MHSAFLVNSLVSMIMSAVVKSQIRKAGLSGFEIFDERIGDDSRKKEQRGYTFEKGEQGYKTNRRMESRGSKKQL